MTFSLRKALQEEENKAKTDTFNFTEAVLIAMNEE